MPITVTASTDNRNDYGYHHCFEQNPKATLTFEVETDPSVDNINFVLWDLEDAANPKARESGDYAVVDGQVTITIGPDKPPHLGPGPYCAALTASSSAAAPAASKSAGKIVGNALYYYETWYKSRDCKYH